MKLRSAIAVMALMASLCATSAASAAVYTVDTTNDTVDADTSVPACADAAGDCSLRAAIDQANENPEDDTINVPDGRYVLTIEGDGENGNQEGDLDVGHTGPRSGDTEIVGESTADTVIDADGIDRVLHIFDGSTTETSTDVDISDLTVTGGFVVDQGGGGILNQAWDTLTLVRVRVTRNASLGGGGGIENAAHMVVLGSTVDRNNTAASGGGICSTGELNVEDSTVSDNDSNTFLLFGEGGGGIYQSREGGCARIIYIPCLGECGRSDLLAEEEEPELGLTLENSTIDGNDTHGLSAGGGLHIQSSNASLLNVTLSDNEVLIPEETEGSEGQNLSPAFRGGGIYAGYEATVDFKNTIVADNLTGGSADNCDGGPFLDLGHNLENLDDCGFTETTSKVETPALLERLSDNGGPTHTRALRDGSPAIDSADNETCPDDDQRGEDRPPPDGLAGPICDIGAYEKQSAPPPPPAPPAPPTQSAVQPQQAPQGEAPCSPAPPRSSISRSSLRGSPRAVAIIGRSTDLRCAETRLRGGVSSVKVSVARIVSNTAGAGSRCRFLTADGDLSRTRDCDDRVFLNGRLGRVRDGKVPWTLRKRRLDLPSGRYQVVALATDRDGNAETIIRRFNSKRFTIR